MHRQLEWPVSRLWGQDKYVLQIKLTSQVGTSHLAYFYSNQQSSNRDMPKMKKVYATGKSYWAERSWQCKRKEVQLEQENQGAEKKQFLDASRINSNYRVASRSGSTAATYIRTPKGRNKGKPNESAGDKYFLWTERWKRMASFCISGFKSFLKISNFIDFAVIYIKSDNKVLLVALFQKNFVIQRSITSTNLIINSKVETKILRLAIKKENWKLYIKDFEQK